ncbi:hypothetical protein OnM2_c1194o25 [Erysiphe neolycopersici]|uniref:Secreted protein n=1 Tax=Erysiphe neolycopersici TaxID=212602 RepID=A0A420I5S0_9PEZI|nr:hypothetical protein OnM2_c1194o25 [Erysiphe neolycopersici]
MYMLLLILVVLVLLSSTKNLRATTISILFSRRHCFSSGVTFLIPSTKVYLCSIFGFWESRICDAERSIGARPPAMCDG